MSAENPILNSPYHEPKLFYDTDSEGSLNYSLCQRRNDEAITSEPEQIKAFRDTWELGIHSSKFKIRTNEILYWSNR